MNINTVGSIFNSARKDAENEVKQVVHALEGIVETDVEKVEETVKADTSRLIHSVKVEAISTGVDILVKLDHAAGEVKRIVINGTVSLEQLITHLRSLAGN